MSDVATRLAKEFDQFNDVDYYRAVNKDGILDLIHPIELDYTWTPDHVVKIKPPLYERNKKNLICRSPIKAPQRRSATERFHNESIIRKTRELQKSM